ncbi:MAG: DUF2141 domain-containing protein [Woeseiaceae bacterium]
MNPVTSLTGSLTLSAAMVLGLGLLASSIPTSATSPNTVEVNLPATVSSKRATAVAESGLQVEITNVRINKGKVIVLVFDNVNAFETYDYERAVGYAEVEAERGAVNAQFPDLVDGPFAVTFFHDENEDYDLNMDGLYPLEGYGTSGAKDPYDEPTFDDASVNSSRVSVQTYYLR